MRSAEQLREFWALHQSSTPLLKGSGFKNWRKDGPATITEMQKALGGVPASFSELEVLLAWAYTEKRLQPVKGFGVTAYRQENFCLLEQCTEAYIATRFGVFLEWMNRSSNRAPRNVLGALREFLHHREEQFGDGLSIKQEITGFLLKALTSSVGEAFHEAFPTLELPEEALTARKGVRDESTFGDSPLMAEIEAEDAAISASIAEKAAEAKKREAMQRAAKIKRDTPGLSAMLKEAASGFGLHSSDIPPSFAKKGVAAGMRLH